MSLAGNVLISKKLDVQNALLATIASNLGTGGISISNWLDVQRIVRMGLAGNIFTIGDQFTATYGGIDKAWDVIGIDHDIPTDKRFTHSLTIQAHDALLDAQWDAPESLYYTEAGLAAGTYNFINSSVTYQFTLTLPVPAKGCLTFPWAYDTDILTAKISSYPTQASTVAIESVSISVGSAGTALTPTNHIDRCRYGSNNYLQSNISKWLKSPEATFVWAPQTVYDRPSTAAPYTGGGFLKQLDADLVAVLGAVDKQVARNTIIDGGGQEAFAAKAFLLSMVEVYGGTEGVTTGEKPYAYYSALAANPTTAALGGRVKYLSGSARHWWLRSPDPGYTYYARCVSTTGTVTNIGAYNTFAVAPACCIV